MATYNVQSKIYRESTGTYDELNLNPAQHADTHATGGTDPLSPNDIGAVDISGATMTGILTASVDSTYTIPKVRNSSLNATETTPVQNGTIAWTYE